MNQFLILFLLSSFILLFAPNAQSANAVHIGISTNIVRHDDAAGILHAHSILNKIHIYDASPGQNPKYLASSSCFAIDNHHIISTYLFISSTVVSANQKIYISTPTGLAEVFVQYIDIFNGLSLLYSPTEIKGFLNFSNLATKKLSTGEALKIIAPAGDNLDNTEAFYEGTINDEIHQVHTLKTSISLTSTQSNGSLLVNSNGQIVGIYQGHYYTSTTESLTPNDAFLYLIEKAIKVPTFKSDINAIRGQLGNQMKSYQGRVLLALDKSIPVKKMDLDKYSIVGIPDFFKCEISATPEMTAVCLPRLPIYAFESQPATDIRAKFQLITSPSVEDLATSVHLESRNSRDFFSGKKMICAQQQTRTEFTNDAQMHFCTKKNDLMDKSFDTLIRGSTVNAKKTNLYFEFLIKDLPSSGTLKVSNLFLEAIKGEGGK